jgi:hypothetical protein
MDKIVKIVLMTKNEIHLIKPWIQYHGEIFGYENLHIIDDSDDVDVLNYYKSINHLPINFYFNENQNLNNVIDNINNIMTSEKNNCDFIIKLDTDEFIGIYNNKTDNVSIYKEIIRNSFNNLTINGYKYKCSYTLNTLPLDSRNNPLEYIYFSKPCFTDFKTFFYSKTYLHCDLGSHVGCVISPYEKDNIHNETNICIIHYHNQSVNQYINNSKKCIISHNYISINDDLTTQINKLTILSKLSINSIHRVQIYLQHLTDPLFENNDE